MNILKNKRQSVSLVIPAYNEERHLKACLDSVAAQTLLPDEVIVVDNNSADRTAEIAKKYPFVRLVQEKQQGIVYARGAGFDAAKFKIIARIDADTVLPADWTAHIINFFEKPENANRAWTGGAAFYNVRFANLVSWFYNFMVFRFNRLLNGYPTLWGSNMAVWRESWQAVRSKTCQRADIHEDLDLAIHLHNAGYQIVYDTSMKVQTQLRRVRSGRHELWDYLQWWPRTLRIHDRWNWIICWLFGCALLYLLTPLLSLAELLARKFGKQPLTDS